MGEGNVQTIPFLIGQPLTKKPNITVVKLFNEQNESEVKDDSLTRIQVPALQNEKVNLWAAEGGGDTTQLHGLHNPHDWEQ